MRHVQFFHTWNQSRDVHRNPHILYYLYRKVSGDGESFIRYRYGEVFKGSPTPLAISIEPELLKRPEIVKNLMTYHTIIARESITYEALVEMVKKASKMQADNRSPVSTGEVSQILLLPDPAFTLPKKELPLPEGFKEGNTIGINVSPMIRDNETKAEITMENYRELLRYIIENTDSQIALIPHVVWERNDDRKPIHELYEEFQETGRVHFAAQNIAFGQIGNLITQLLGFVLRTVFIAHLGDTLNGINALYTSILSVLSMQSRRITSRPISLP